MGTTYWLGEEIPYQLPKFLEQCLTQKIMILLPHRALFHKTKKVSSYYLKGNDGDNVINHKDHFIYENFKKEYTKYTSSFLRGLQYYNGNIPCLSSYHVNFACIT